MSKKCACPSCRDNGFGFCVVCGNAIDYGEPSADLFGFNDNGRVIDVSDRPLGVYLLAVLGVMAIAVATFLWLNEADAMARCMERASFDTCHYALFR